MYENYFGLIERPFSIAPDPQYLYMSKRHKEAMAHLSYGLTQGGCFIVLTGEVGTGKTTLCRNLLGELPGDVDVALILNANINELELLQSICDELKIGYDESASQKQLLDSINRHLLATFADNRHTVLIIDEAQLLSRDVLEQIRLLTNLETTKAKLLQIILIGQPELNELLSRNDLRQLAQRVTARYHLGALDRSEIEDYVNFRLAVAGCKQPLFSRQALHKLHVLTDGIPRKINVLADHALLAAYADTARLVDAKTVKAAASDVFIEQASKTDSKGWFSRTSVKWLVAATALLLVNVGLWAWFGNFHSQSAPVSAEQIPQSVSPTAAPITSQTPVTEPAPAESAGNPTPGKVVIAELPLDDSPLIPAELAEQFEPQIIQEAEENIAQPMDVEPQAEEEFLSLLATSADKTSRINAFRKLASLWGKTLPQQIIQPACLEVANSGLRCLGFADWQQWMRYNRPAVLVVSHQQQLHRVVVRAISDQTAQVLVGDQLIELPLSELQRSWAGQGVLFWQPPSGAAPFLQPGDSGTAVVAAREQLNQALLASHLPLLESKENPDFDLDMAQKLFALQTRYEIVNDSKIGNETWLLINEITAPRPLPLLRSRG